MPMQLLEELKTQHGELECLIAVEADSLVRLHREWTEACDKAGGDEGEAPAARMAEDALDEQMEALRRMFDADRHLRAAIAALQPDAE